MSVFYYYFYSGWMAYKSNYKIPHAVKIRANGEHCKK